MALDDLGRSLRLAFFARPPRLLLLLRDADVAAHETKRLEEPLVLGDALAPVPFVLALDGRHVVECGFSFFFLDPLDEPPSRA